MKTEIAQRLTVLRGLMAKAGVNAAIINKTDPHQSEYIGAHWAFCVASAALQAVPPPW